MIILIFQTLGPKSDPRPYIRPQTPDKANLGWSLFHFQKSHLVEFYYFRKTLPPSYGFWSIWCTFDLLFIIFVQIVQEHYTLVWYYLVWERRIARGKWFHLFSSISENTFMVPHSIKRSYSLDFGCWFLIYVTQISDTCCAHSYPSRNMYNKCWLFYNL